MFTWTFWRDALERAVKTAAQTILTGLSLSAGFNLLELDWVLAAGLAGGGFVWSILSSVASYSLTRSPSAIPPEHITRILP